MTTTVTTAALLILLAAATVQARCPDQSLLRPCTCLNSGSKYSSVRCSNFTNVDDLQRVMDATVDYRFDEFELSDSNIPYLNATWLVQKKIDTLTLRNTTLVGLFDRTPDITLPLNQIFIYNSVLLRRLQWAHFKPFVRLGYLEFLETEVKDLGKSFKENVSPELRMLYLNDTNTVQLDDGVFKGKTKLMWITIRWGTIKVLKKSFFEDQKDSLYNMDFSYNPIESLPIDLFHGLRKLQKVSLNGTKITTLPVFQVEEALGQISIHGSPLECDCRMRWILADRSFDLIGTCNSPPTLKSKELEDLTEDDFSACAPRRNALPFVY